MPGVPPLRRKMMSSANWWASWRAVSSLASPVYCLAKIWGYCVFLASSRKPLATRRPFWTPRLPKATMAALAGAVDHWERLISAWKPGVVWGMRLLDTMSKMPAEERSEKSTVSKVFLKAEASPVVGLKLAAARRMLVAPELV